MDAKGRRAGWGDTNSTNGREGRFSVGGEAIEFWL
jgi:hypothetical protein